MTLVLPKYDLCHAAAYAYPNHHRPVMYTYCPLKQITRQQIVDINHFFE
jgi:hypothetical protein